MTTPISSSTSSSVPLGDVAPAPSTSGASLLQPNTFLSLLVAELRYQDPMNPTNSSSFMSQIAQLSQVEQLQSLASSSNIGSAASLIGKTVTGTDANGNIITGAVTGVTNGASGPTLNVGTNVIDMSRVTQIGTA